MKLKIIFTSALVFAFVSGIYLINSGIYSISSDETSRTLIAYYWFKYGIIESTSWLPLHFFIMGISFNLAQDLIWVPRILTLIFGLLTILNIGLISKELFDRTEIIIYSLLIALLIPQRVILSIVPLPEIIFFFFITGASLLFIKWLKSENISFLYLSAAFISIAGILRYEGWIFAAVLILLIAARVKNIRHRILLPLLLSAFPLFWVVSNYIKYDDFLFFLNEPQIYFNLAQDDTFGSRIIFNPLMQFIGQNLITLNVFGLAGLYFNRNNRLIRKWMIIFLTPLLLFSIASISGKSLPAHNFWRTSAVWVILIIPFTAYFLAEARKKLRRYFLFSLFPVFFFIQLINANYYYLRNVKQEYCLTEEKLQTAAAVIKYAEKNFSDDERILIENVNTFEHLEISLASQDPLRFIFSERHRLKPVNFMKYAEVKINYFLVKSEEMKEDLKSEHVEKLLNINGWTLYGKEKRYLSRKE